MGRKGVKSYPTNQKGSCILDLLLLSGTPELQGERFEVRPNYDGTYQILVNKKNTGNWIDKNGFIGSYSGGGPTIIQWIKWYGYSYKEALKIARKYGVKIDEK